MTRPIRHLAIVAPSGPVPSNRFQAGLEILEGMGRTVEVFFDPDAGKGGGFLAGSDATRSARFLEAAAGGADAVMAARGGYGAYRLLRHLPFEAPGPPCLLIGFSDITALLLGLPRRWGWGAVHGPNVTTLGDLDTASLDAFRALLDAPGKGARFEGLDCLHPGIGEGPLTGGNLSVLCSLLGTPEEPDLSGRVLFLEDTAEAPYRLDRLLHQLASCRTFPAAAGLVVGDLGSGFDDAVLRSLVSLCAAHGVPAAAGLPVGHGHSNQPLFLGGSALLDADRGGFATSQY